MPFKKGNTVNLGRTRLSNEERVENRRASVKKYNDKRYETKEYKDWLIEYKANGGRKKALRKYRIGEKNKKAQKRYIKKRYKTDVSFRISTSLRNRLHKAFKGNYKTGSGVKDLGCSIEEFKVHLGNLFTEDMSFDNYGEWEIDHIKPLSLFDLTQRSQVLYACHYTNLQPLWKEDNRLKSNKYADNDDYILETIYRTGGIDKINPRVEITITHI